MMIKSLAKKSTGYFFVLASSKLLSFAAFILYARVLLPKGFGEFIFFITLVQVVTYFADFGLVQWYQKQAHREKNPQVFFREILVVRTFTLLISFFIGAVIATLSHFSLPMVTFFVLMLIPEAYLSILDAYYLFVGKPNAVGLKTILRMVFYLFGYALFVQSFTLQTALFLFGTGSIGTLLILFPWWVLKTSISMSYQKIVQLLKKSSSYAILITTSFAYSRGDALAVQYLLGSVALGIYSSAYRFLEALSIFPVAVAQTLFPVSAKEKTVNAKHAQKIVITMGVLGGLLGFLLYFFAPLIVTLTLGESYLAVVPLLRIFALVIFLFFLNSPLSTIVQSSGLVAQFLPYGVANTVLNITLNFALVPVFGLAAAAWVMCATEATGFAINLIFIRRVYKD